MLVDSVLYRHHTSSYTSKICVLIRIKSEGNLHWHVFLSTLHARKPSRCVTSMENVGQYSSTLVYPSPTSRTHDTPDNHSVNASSSWLQSHKQPSAGSPGANNQSSPVYPVVDRSADHENYASPPTSASYGSMHSADQYSNFPQSPSVRTTDEAHSVPGMGLPTQVSGSIGPDRVTRRQTRTHSSLHLGIRRDRPPQPDVQTGQPDNEEVRPLSASWRGQFILTSFRPLRTATCLLHVSCQCYVQATHTN